MDAILKQKKILKGGNGFRLSSARNNITVLQKHTLNVLILLKITCELPKFQVDASALNTFKHLKLADVNCLQPGPIDILLGADVFGDIMLNRRLNAPGQSLTAMESIFGWVVLGKTKLYCQRIISNHASYNEVEFQLDKFWQLELSETKPFTNEENACENHFKRTHARDQWRTQRGGPGGLDPQSP
ncbi:DUF1758 domain-containing protein [Trichonephila clavipes]|nr:DUF1758 domain-containing protein [Trichonephila clavipes]